MPDRVGQQLGNYRLVQLLGKGGFAEVYLGQHVRLSSKQAAIKILYLVDVDTRRFQEEAETTEQLLHPHIVRLLDFDIADETPFLVLDYAPGGSLRNRHARGSNIPLAQVGSYLKEIAPALQYAHDLHILHRDIKPDNVLIGRQGELLLSDFGISVLTQTGRTTFSTTYGIGGTPFYMAPETFRGRPEKASDQYALAAMVYEWLCGDPPFSNGGFIQLGYQHAHEPVPPLREKNPHIPSDVEQVVMTALAKDPKARFGSVQAFATALEQASYVEVENAPSGSAQAASPFPPQQVPLSLQGEKRQAESVVQQSEPPLASSSVQAELPIQAPADIPVLQTDNKESITTMHEEVHATPSEDASSLNNESASPSATPAHSTSSITPPARMEMASPWAIGRAQIIATAVGAASYSVMKMLFIRALIAAFHPFLTLTFPATIASALVFAILSFFATEFGPWVGLVVALVGWGWGDLLVASSVVRYTGSPWYSYVSIGLFGFLGGLAFIRTRGRYRTGTGITTAIVVNVTAVVVSLAFFLICERIVDPYNWLAYLRTFALATVIALVLLPLALLTYEWITRYNVSTP